MATSMGISCCKIVFHYKISDVDQLKHVLIDCWVQLSQDTLKPAINKLPKRLMIVIKARVEFHLD